MKQSELIQGEKSTSCVSTPEVCEGGNGWHSIYLLHFVIMGNGGKGDGSEVQDSSTGL